MENTVSNSPSLESTNSGELIAENTSLPPPLPLGARLKAAREESNISRQQVVNQFKIPMKWLEAIEESRWAVVGTPTYCKSYIRDLAKMVGMDVEAELQTLFPNQGLYAPASKLSRHAAAEPPANRQPPSLANSSAPMPPTIILQDFSNHAIAFKTIINVLIALFIAAIVTWQWNTIKGWINPSLAQRNSLEKPTALTLPVGVNLSATPSQNSIHDSTEQSATMAIPSLALPENTTPSVGLVGFTNNPSALDISHSSEADVAIPSNSFANLSVKLPAPSPLLYQLTVTTVEASWVQALTLNDQVIVEAMVLPDQPLIRTIKAPFRVVIGNAETTKVSYNGKAISLRPHFTENGNARLVLRP